MVSFTAPQYSSSAGISQVNLEGQIKNKNMKLTQKFQCIPMYYYYFLSQSINVVFFFIIDRSSKRTATRTR